MSGKGLGSAPESVSLIDLCGDVQSFGVEGKEELLSARLVPSFSGGGLGSSRTTADLVELVRG